MICDLISENSFPILVILYAFFNPLRDRSYNFVLEESNIKLNDHSRIFSRNFMTRGTYFEYNWISSNKKCRYLLKMFNILKSFFFFFFFLKNVLNSRCWLEKEGDFRVVLWGQSFLLIFLFSCLPIRQEFIEKKIFLNTNRGWFLYVGSFI